MCGFVCAALSEAQDVNLHLKAVKPCIDDLAQADFDVSKPLIPPLFHVICLTWAHSEHYNVSPRLIVLLAEISNLLISQVPKHTSSPLLNSTFSTIQPPMPISSKGAPAGGGRKLSPPPRNQKKL